MLLPAFAFAFDNEINVRATHPFQGESTNVLMIPFPDSQIESHT